MSVTTVPENFAKGRRFGFFPAFSLGWRIAQESFMENTRNWLDNLKLRASYGQVGNDSYSQRFLYEQKWSQIGNDYYFGTSGQTVSSSSSIPTTQLPGSAPTSTT